jgi:V/A-type H+-transporting ATPase subunit K
MVVIASVVVVLMIAFGIYVRNTQNKIIGKNAKKLFTGSILASMMFIFFVGAGLLLVNVNKVYGQNNETAQAQVQAATEAAPAAVEASAPAGHNPNAGMGYLAAAVAVGLGSLGAAIAVGMSSAAAIGAISENQKIFGLTIVFVGMAEGIAIYGLIIAIMILSRI